jgi:ABC-type Fe3+/spermidine/putrescine transport system ATPase subunit
MRFMRMIVNDITPSTDEMILEATLVSKNFSGDKTSGVNNITIQIPKGKITAVVGESGSGKTTLLKLLSGNIAPDSGKVYFKQKQLGLREAGLTPEHSMIAMATQDNSDMDNEASVWDNVRNGLPESEIKYQIQKTTQALNVMGVDGLRGQKFGELSGGEKQRVTMAKALINHPEVLMLDEPFNHVDGTYRDALQQDIRHMVKNMGVTVILVSHDPAELLSMADELVVIREGEIVESGKPEVLYHSPQLLYTAKILVSCTRLTAADAKKCGINAKKSEVIVYAEHIQISRRAFRKNWEVKQVLFKGFFEELVIEKDYVTLRVLNYRRSKYAVGDRIGIKIKKHYEYGKWLS